MWKCIRTMNQELPKLTRMTIKMSEITDKYSIHIGVILIIIVSSFYIMKKKKVINFDKYIFKLPIFGKINKNIFIKVFAKLYTYNFKCRFYKIFENSV